MEPRRFVRLLISQDWYKVLETSVISRTLFLGLGLTVLGLGLGLGFGLTVLGLGLGLGHDVLVSVLYFLVSWSQSTRLLVFLKCNDF